MSETFRLGLLLAAVGGYLDAYTYLARGGVFANAQTGNIVLLGLSAAQGRWWAALYYLFPILAFVAGVTVTEAVRQRFTGSRLTHWRQIVIALETAVLAGVALLPQGYDPLANIAVSFVCSMQVQSFRKVRGHAYATTMCTGNLRSASELLCLYARTREGGHLRGAGLYLGVILAFAAGAAAGTLAAGAWGRPAVLAACGMLAAVFGLMFQKTGEPTRSV